MLLLLVPEPKCIDPLWLLTQLGWMVSIVNTDACAVLPLIPQQSSQSLELHWQPCQTLVRGSAHLLSTEPPKLPTQLLFHCFPGTFTQASFRPLPQTHWLPATPLTPSTLHLFHILQRSGSTRLAAGKDTVDHGSWYEESVTTRLQVN